jgi:hypothetical protein
MLACVIAVGGVQMFFYNLLPTSLPIILIAIGLISRGDRASEDRDALQAGTMVGAVAVQPAVVARG